MFEYSDHDGNNGVGSSSSCAGSSGIRITEEEYHGLETDFKKNN
jgi:hypothetical protein